MILKNCHIYDESGSKERNVDILFNEKIKGYATGLQDELSGEARTVYKLSELNGETVRRINSAPDKAVIDAEGIIAVPGGIDPHVHFDTPGFTDREDFFHGSMSAAAGGITTVIDMPCTSLPPVTNGQNFDIKMQAVKAESCVDFAFYGGVDSSDFVNYKHNMEELAHKGVKGFKVYFMSGMQSYPRVTKYQFLKIMQHARDLKLPVLVHAEDYELLDGLAKELRDSPDDYLRYYKARPALGEILAAADAVKITRAVHGNLHIVHVASAAAARILNAALDDVNVTYETCPHYLYYTYADYKVKGSSLKTMPGVKDEIDRNELWEFLKNGYCSFVSSDHAPAKLCEKNTGSFWQDYGGIPGTQTLIPVVFSEGYMKNRISLKRFVEITSKKAALRYNLYPRKGNLLEGADADITLIDNHVKWKFSLKDLLSRGETTPFDGETFNGKVALTILRGKIIYSAMAGITAEKGYGHYL